LSAGWQVEFTCPGCDKEWTEQNWTFSDDVTCPNCSQVWGTEWDYDDVEEGNWWAWCVQRTHDTVRHMAEFPHLGS
jgi:hypothetical protein